MAGRAPKAGKDAQLCGPADDDGIGAEQIMRVRRLLLILGLIVPARSGLAVAQTSAPASCPATSAAENGRYSFHKDHDPNGIGKFYMDREIAQVMGHQAADWLERPER